MTLATEVQTRVSSALLIQLTNQGDTPASAIDTDVLDAAVADAEAEFFVQVGIPLDDTVATHVQAGVTGVMFFLHSYTFTETAQLEKLRTRWFQAVANLATSIGGERRILPSTTSELDPSEQPAGVRPDQDRTRWEDFVPDPPYTSGEEDVTRD